MGALSRRKGHAFERWLVHQFRAAMPGATVRRGFQARSGEEAADVDTPVFWVEAKRGRKPNVRAALEQATAASPKGRMPIAVIRDDRAEAFVALGLRDFLELVEQLWTAADNRNRGGC
jgi:hypothetical protein